MNCGVFELQYEYTSLPPGNDMDIQQEVAEVTLWSMNNVFGVRTVASKYEYSGCGVRISGEYQRCLRSIDDFGVHQQCGVGV